jgi:hypothetical protein
MDRQRRIELFLLAAHRLAIARLREDPARVEELRSVLRRWRAQRGETRSDAYFDEWEALLDRPIEEVERVVCANDDRAVALRSTSPIAPLITSAERERLLGEAGRL